MEHTEHTESTGRTASTEYYDLDTYGRSVTTSSPEAQRWFDRGLVWSYAFHHEEAVACVEAAVRADGDVAHPPETALRVADRLRGLAAVDRVPETRRLFNNTCRDVLAIASAMLDGELEYRKGNHGPAFAAPERSVALDDDLTYDEPWGWMQPTRHACGALLLEQGRIVEAEAVYRADLGLDDTLPRPSQHPGNVWSLHGLHECLVRLGKEAEARIVAQRLKFASALADIPVQASCFCRLDAVADTDVDTGAHTGSVVTPGCCAMDN